MSEKTASGAEELEKALALDEEIDDVAAELEKAGKATPPPKKAPPPPPPDEEEEEEEYEDEYEEEEEEEEEEEKAFAGADDFFRSFMGASSPEELEVVDATEVLEALIGTIGQEYGELGRRQDNLARSFSALDDRMAAMEKTVNLIALGLSRLLKGPAPEEHQPMAGVMPPSVWPQPSAQTAANRMVGVEGGKFEKAAVRDGVQTLIEKGKIDSAILALIDTRGPDAVVELLTPDQRREAGLV